MNYWTFVAPKSEYLNTLFDDWVEHFRRVVPPDTTVDTMTYENYSQPLVLSCSINNINKRWIVVMLQRVHVRLETFPRRPDQIVLLQTEQLSRPEWLQYVEQQLKNNVWVVDYAPSNVTDHTLHRFIPCPFPTVRSVDQVDLIG